MLNPGTLREPLTQAPGCCHDRSLVDEGTPAGSVNNLVTTVNTGLNETGVVVLTLVDTDLTLRVTGHYEGAFEYLKMDTNAVADELTEVVGQLRTTSRGVKSATSEILSGANDLSERTAKQAATIEETAAAVEQRATTVNENAYKADAATGKTEEAARLTEDGGRVMTDTNEATERIASSPAHLFRAVISDCRVPYARSSPSRKSPCRIRLYSGSPQ